MAHIQTIGSDTVRRNLAGLIHQILTNSQMFMIEYYGRPVALLAPAGLPEQLRHAAGMIRAGQTEEAIGFLECLAGPVNGNAQPQ